MNSSSRESLNIAFSIIFKIIRNLQHVLKFSNGNRVDTKQHVCLKTSRRLQCHRGQAQECVLIVHLNSVCHSGWWQKDHASLMTLAWQRCSSFHMHIKNTPKERVLCFFDGCSRNVTPPDLNRFLRHVFPTLCATSPTLLHQRIEGPQSVTPAIPLYPKYSAWAVVFMLGLRLHSKIAIGRKPGFSSARCNWNLPSLFNTWTDIIKCTFLSKIIIWHTLLLIIEARLAENGAKNCKKFHLRVVINAESNY